jgi:hypothetical protein
MNGNTSSWQPAEIVMISDGYASACRCSPPTWNSVEESCRPWVARASSQGPISTVDTVVSQAWLAQAYINQSERPAAPMSLVRDTFAPLRRPHMA